MRRNWYLLLAGLFHSCWAYGLEIECGRVMEIPLGTLGCMMCYLLTLSRLEVLRTAVWHSLEYPQIRNSVSLRRCFSSWLSSNGWLRKAVVPVASFQEDAESGYGLICGLSMSGHIIKHLCLPTCKMMPCSIKRSAAQQRNVCLQDR